MEVDHGSLFLDIFKTQLAENLSNLLQLTQDLGGGGSGCDVVKISRGSILTSVILWLCELQENWFLIKTLNSELLGQKDKTGIQERIHHI